jgi:1-pyrroline-5-carboxylate dehydrogenase
MPKIPVPQNEPVRGYTPGSPERDELKRTLKDLSSRQIEIPIIVGGKELKTGKTLDAVMPHCHQHVLAKVHQAGTKEVEAAIQAARAGWSDWAAATLEQRAAVFLKAADLLAGKYRATVNAATMLGQSKTAHQAEIDAACELIDFFRFNAHFAERIQGEQPVSAPGTWNVLDYRPLEGFVYAISPFNFTSIGGNLSSAPALMGTTVVWKPAGTAVYSNYFLMKLMQEAGLPPGVINFLPGPAAAISDALLADRHLGGIHFTGSTEVFQTLWDTVAKNLRHYADYPRLVGETGGKDFIAAHASADPDELATAIVRGAFEYQGQKCSAASRAYVPDNLWPAVRERVVGMLERIRVGDPADFRNFMGAVIDRKAFDKIKGRSGAVRRRVQRQRRVFHSTDAVRGRRSALPHDVRGDLRPGAHAARLPRAAMGADAGAREYNVTVRAHGRRVRARPAGGERGADRAALRGGEFLRQRQTHRRRRRPAAVRGSAGQRH